MKADALYHLGNFEHALVYYSRGLRCLEQHPWGTKKNITGKDSNFIASNMLRKTNTIKAVKQSLQDS